MSVAEKPQALLDYLRLAADYLAKCGSDSPRLDAELLLAHVLKLDRVALYVNHDRPLVKEEVDAFRELLRQRGRGVPMAYILGEKPFLTTSLAVTPAVLIPRPETELLVEAVVEEMGAFSGDELFVADVGTGSGAIAIGVAFGEQRARVVALDVSAEAAEVAATNVERHRLGERVRVVVGDLLTPLLSEADGASLKGRLDVVVSNPPYIASGEWATLPKDVREFEPRLALDGGADGLDVYRRLIPMAAEALRPGGLLALEIGADQGETVPKLLADDGNWVNVSVRQDYAGHDRIVLAFKRGADAS